jgi:hypothetical protein
VGGVCSVVLFNSLWNKTTEHTPPTSNYWTKQPNTHLPRQTIEQNNRTHPSHVKLWNKTTEHTPPTSNYGTKLKTTEHTPPTSNYGTKQPNTHLPSQTMEQNNRTHTCQVKLWNKTTEHTHSTSNYGQKQTNTHLTRQTIEQNNRTPIVWRGRCVYGCFFP